MFIMATVTGTCQGEIIDPTTSDADQEEKNGRCVRRARGCDTLDRFACEHLARDR
jgi:hypothetical protein